MSPITNSFLKGGVYFYRFRLVKEARLTVGRLGVLRFPAAYYIYTGSAQGRLASRLARHNAFPGEEYKLHWHVDYLSALAVDKAFAVVRTENPLECVLNRAAAGLPGAKIAARGFGCSDCRCPSHLHRLTLPEWPVFPGLEPWDSSQFKR